MCSCSYVILFFSEEGEWEENALTFLSPWFYKPVFKAPAGILITKNVYVAEMWNLLKKLNY